MPFEKCSGFGEMMDEMSRFVKKKTFSGSPIYQFITFHIFLHFFTLIDAAEFIHPPAFPAHLPKRRKNEHIYD